MGLESIFLLKGSLCQVEDHSGNPKLVGVMVWIWTNFLVATKNAGLGGGGGRVAIKGCPGNHRAEASIILTTQLNDPNPRQSPGTAVCLWSSMGSSK